MLSSWMEEHRRWREKGEVAEAETAKQGKGRQELPWIWKMQFETTKPNRDKGSDTVEQWTMEAMPIEWLHAHASVARFEEEMKLLEAESELNAVTLAKKESSLLEPFIFTQELLLLFTQQLFIESKNALNSLLLQESDSDSSDDEDELPAPLLSNLYPDMLQQLHLSQYLEQWVSIPKTHEQLWLTLNVYKTEHPE
ncbi:hypothetical protein M422DRAFT_255129 [Sphaerobolus stellatus SS14]|uniref:Uncharacterized protein n=1 Tax=Sphaerobolus stellatus (strain SS14) TaxID=990650 RepID=A0A0C9VJM3_SPHS4|nr:hypothetical protein M422DRAFT_255129 [Sphaerobolus stellatus SS14]